MFRMIALGLILLAGCSGMVAVTPTPNYVDELLGAVFDPPRVLQEFNLASTEGDTFQLSDQRGDVILLYFGYRSCPDFCPATFSDMRRVYQELGDLSERVKVVFVTVDPERDTLDLVTQYTHAFNEDFIGLRGEDDALQAVLDQFGAVAEKRLVGESALSYLMDHTASVFLIAPDGRLLSQYLYGTDYLDIVHDVRLILNATPTFASGNDLVDESASTSSLYDLWARPTTAGASVGAIYGLIANSGEADDRLISAASDVAASIELHEMTMGAGDVMQMRPVEGGILIPAGGATEIQSGGYHVMLIGLTRDLAVGDTFDVTLTLEQAGEITVTVTVRDPDGT